LKEAKKLGFARAIAPEAARAESNSEQGLSLQLVHGLADLVADIAAAGRQRADDGRKTAGRPAAEDRRRRDVG
jgi:DNA repair protein RadA/Sms